MQCFCLLTQKTQCYRKHFWWISLITFLFYWSRNFFFVKYIKLLILSSSYSWGNLEPWLVLSKSIKIFGWSGFRFLHFWRLYQNNYYVGKFLLCILVHFFARSWFWKVFSSFFLFWFWSENVPINYQSTLLYLWN